MRGQAAVSTAIVADMGTAPVHDNDRQDRFDDPLTQDLQAVARADRRAFDRVYTQTVDRVLHLATRVVGDRDLADDVASDAYLQVWRQASRFDPTRGSAIAWILTICRSRALDTLRRQAVAAQYAAKYKDLEHTEVVSEPPDDLLVETDESSRVHRALLKISSDDRQLLALAFFRGYTHKELAAMTGRPMGTIKSKIRRTLQQLKELLGDMSWDAGEKR